MFDQRRSLNKKKRERLSASGKPFSECSFPGQASFLFRKQDCTGINDRISSHSVNSGELQQTF